MLTKATALELEGLDQHKCWAQFENESFGEADVSGAERVSPSQPRSRNK